MITRTFTATELDLIRRCFTAGEPPEMLADPDSMFGQATHDTVCALLAQAMADQPVTFSDSAWRCLNACCSVGCELLFGDDVLTEADCNVVDRAITAHGFVWITGKTDKENGAE